MQRLFLALEAAWQKPKKELTDLRKEMDSRKISKLRPFRQALQHSLENAKIDNKDGTSTSKNTNDNNEEGVILVLIIIIGIIYVIYREYTQRYGKHRVRRSFPQSVREETKRK